MKTSYDLDRDNCIKGVGGDWNAFAQKNGGTDALADLVLGRALWEFVSGYETQNFLNDILFAVRANDEEFTTLYRCDSPERSRLLRMTARPIGNGGVRVSNKLLESNPLGTQSAIIRLDQRRCFNRCSICCRFKVGEDWIDPFASPEREYFPDSHVVCPECRAETAKKLGEPYAVGVVRAFG